MDNISKVFSGAFSFVYINRITLFKTLSLPFTILVILTIAEIVLDLNEIWALVWGVVYCLIHTIFAVTTHRIILLGETSIPEWGLRRVSMREIRFILYSFGIGLLVIPPALLATIPVFGWVLAFVAISYVLGRLSLVFPAIATDQKWSFQDSWVHTKDHQLMMAVTVLIFPIIIALPETLLTFAPYAKIPAAILSTFTTVFVVSALSVAFKMIRNGK